MISSSPATARASLIDQTLHTRTSAGFRVQIIEIAENVCNIKKEEADWILRTDIVEEGDQLEDFPTAATDTTVMAVEWTLAELINHPKILAKAQNEINQVISKTRLVEESDIPHLPYLQAIIKETFRLHPPISMLARKSIQDYKIDNYTILEGTLLFVNIWSMGRGLKVWKNYLEFKLEHFLESENVEVNVSGVIDFKGLHYQLLPFGTGRRRCPGISLAMKELPTILATLIQCFDWKTDGGDQVVDMNERPGLTVSRANDLICVPVARFTPSNLK